MSCSDPVADRNRPLSLPAPCQVARLTRSLFGKERLWIYNQLDAMLADFGNQSDRTGPMHRILIAAMILPAAWLAVPDAAGSKDCAWPKDIHAMEAIHSRPADWIALSEFHREFHSCDSDVVALSISESVISLLGQDGGDLERLNEATLADDDFRAFVLRHVDEMALPSELRRVIANLERCPETATALCQDIRERAEIALVTRPWGDGPHRCNREMAFRAEGIASSTSDWNAFHEIYQIYHVCDDGAIGAGFSYAVVRLLGRSGGGLAELDSLASGDPGFRTFVFRHINALSTPEELEPVIANTRVCPLNLESICEEIRAATDVAIAEYESYR